LFPWIFLSHILNFITGLRNNDSLIFTFDDEDFFFVFMFLK
jgi:hypothetical protein